MPDQLAHIRFARRVLAAADASVRMRVCGDSMAFRCGTFGPDPLFNDPLPAGRAEGLGLHRRPGRVALERMREPVRSGMPWAADYAAGFFCHYALDRLCHPELKAMAARGDVQHVAVETAYDRLLLSRGRDDLPTRLSLSLSQLQAAAVMYEGITASRFRADLRAYWLLRRFLLFGGSSHIAGVPRHIRKSWDGLIPYAEPSPGVIRGMAMLEARIDTSVNEAAEQLNRYFAAIDSDLPLDPWTDADFSGGYSPNREVPLRPKRDRRRG